jgi:hypothetical protein
VRWVEVATSAAIATTRTGRCSRGRVRTSVRGFEWKHRCCEQHGKTSRATRRTP